MISKRIIYFIIFSYWCNLFFSQNKEIDSLEQIVKKSSNPTLQLGKTLLNLGESYFYANRLAEALDCFNKAEKIAEKENDLKLRIDCKNNIGIIYNKNGNIKKCIETLENSLILSLKLKDTVALARAYLNLSYFYNLNKENFKALEYSEKSLALSKAIHDYTQQGYILSNLGNIYLTLRNYQLSESCLLEALKIREKIGDKSTLGESCSYIAKLYIEKKNYSLALKYAEQGFIYAQDKKRLSNLKDANFNLYTIYKELKSADKALKYHEQFMAIKDTLASEKNRKQLIQKEFQIAYDKKVAKDSIQQIEQNKVKEARFIAQNLQLKQEKTFRIALFIGLALIILFLIFVFYRFQIEKKQKQTINIQKNIIEEKAEELEIRQKEIIASINYAKRIQTSLLPTETQLNKALKQKK